MELRLSSLLQNFLSSIYSAVMLGNTVVPTIGVGYEIRAVAS